MWYEQLNQRSVSIASGVPGGLHGWLPTAQRSRQKLGPPVVKLSFSQVTRYIYENQTIIHQKIHKLLEKKQQVYSETLPTYCNNMIFKLSLVFCPRSEPWFIALLLFHDVKGCTYKQVIGKSCTSWCNV